MIRRIQIVFFFLFVVSFPLLCIQSFREDSFSKKLLTNEEKTVNDFWDSIKNELQKTEYGYLSKISVEIDGTNYKLEPLLISADNLIASQEFFWPLNESILKTKTDETKLIIGELIKKGVDSNKFLTEIAKLKVDIDQKVNNFWKREIRDELYLSKYAYLSKTPIKIKDQNYDLGILIKAANERDEQKAIITEGSKLKTWTSNLNTNLNFGPIGKKIVHAKTELVRLVNAKVSPEQFVNTLKELKQKSEEELNTLWEGIKDELKKFRSGYIHLLKKMKIKNRIFYDLWPIFTTAFDENKHKQKVSEFDLETKAALQNLVNEGIDSQTFIDALTKEQKDGINKINNNKNQEDKTSLVVGLATGGSVLVAAGVGGFLYWFFKVRKTS